MSDFWQGFTFTAAVAAWGAFLIWGVPWLWRRSQPSGTPGPVLLPPEGRRRVVWHHKASGARMPLVELEQPYIVAARRSADIMTFCVQLIRLSWQCSPQASSDFVRQHFSVREIVELAELILDLSGWVGYELQVDHESV